MMKSSEAPAGFTLLILANSKQVPQRNTDKEWFELDAKTPYQITVTHPSKAK